MAVYKRAIGGVFMFAIRILIVLLAVGTLLVFAQTSALAPFIYTIF